MTVHDKKIEAIIRDVATRIIYPRFRNLQDHEIRAKSAPMDRVTDIDEAAEAALEEQLLALAPDAAIIGEESVSCDPDRLDRLRDSRVFVIDPIDGTHSFIEGLNGFGIMLAELAHGALQAGWIYDIMADTMYHARQGYGAYCNDVPLKPAAREASSPIRSLIGANLYKKSPVQTARRADTRLEIDKAVEPSVLAYSRFLMGDLDALIYRYTNCWDHAPGLAMVYEQGGIGRHWDDTAFDPARPDKGLIVARDDNVYTAIAEHVITPVMHDKMPG
jgi:fructose-1,6-bisphosphatase/inositol monophosphatase family enzyme